VPRSLLVFVLLITSLLGGCAHQQPAVPAAPDPDQELAETVCKYSRPDNWEERHITVFDVMWGGEQVLACVFIYSLLCLGGMGK
jgi:hypothetical protein